MNVGDEEENVKRMGVKKWRGEIDFFGNGCVGVHWGGEF